MDTSKEIKRIVERLSKKKRYKDINSLKLKYLFDNIELNAPAFNDDFFSIARYKEKSRDRVEEKESFFTVIINQLITLRPVLVPALALVVILTGYLFYSMMPHEERYSGSVYSVEGTVRLIRGDTKKRIAKDIQLYQGDKIKVEPNSYIDINIGDYVNMRITENSIITIDELKVDNNHNIVFSLMKGRCLTSVKKIAKGDRVIVNTPLSVGVVRGTIFGAQYNGKTAHYEVYDGKIRVNYRVNGDINDTDARLKLSDYFKDHAVIINKNQYCKVSSNKKLIDKYIDSNNRGVLKGLDLPSVYPLSIAKALMLEDVKRFVQNTLDDSNKNSVYPYYISVKPERAHVYIDGKLQEQGLVYLQKGKHKLRVTSKGFKQRDISINVDQSMKNLQIHMDPRNDSYAIWHSGLRSGYIFYEPDLSLLIAVDADGIISASNLKHVLWTRSLDSSIAVEPVMLNRKLYIAANDGSISSIDLSKGKTLWKTKIKESIVTTMKVIHDASSVYVAASEGFLYRLDKATGAVKWEKHFPYSIKTGPVLAGSMIFTALHNGWLSGVKIETGQETRKVQFNHELTSLVSSHNKLFFTTDMGVLHCYDHMDNRVLWKYSDESSVVAELSVKGKSLYAYSNAGNIYKFDLSGNKIWEQYLGDSISMWPAEDSKNLYFSGTDNLFVVNKHSGEVVWSFVVRDLLTKTIALSPDKIFLVSGNKGLMVLNK